MKANKKSVKVENKSDIISTKAQYNTYYSRPLSYMHSFYLYEVGFPEAYTDWFETMRSATENDIIKIHINSTGGNLNTTIQLIRAMAECKGTIVASVEGECISAATMILMNTDMIEISDYSIFMFHNYSGGAIGKGGEIYDKVTFEKPWIESIMRDCYTGFLTDEEIERMLDGKDFWMTGDEVLERVQRKAELMKAEEEEQDEEMGDTDMD
jgi:ATP-dependent Clp protease protease subunit